VQGYLHTQHSPDERFQVAIWATNPLIRSCRAVARLAT
jgi:hypothetical protein